MNAIGSRLSHRKQQLWVCIIAGLFVCDFVVCGYLPSQQRLTSLQQARAQQRRTIEMATAQGTELPALKAKLRDTERIVEDFETYVPSDNALGSFLQRATTLMTEHELTDQVVLPGKELEAGDLGCIPIHMTCRGTLANLFGFFRGLHAMDRLVRIENVVLENDAGFTGHLTMQTDAVIYYYRKHPAAQETAAMEPAGGASHGA